MIAGNIGLMPSLLTWLIMRKWAIFLRHPTRSTATWLLMQTNHTVPHNASIQTLGWLPYRWQIRFRHNNTPTTAKSARQALKCPSAVRLYPIMSHRTARNRLDRGTAWNRSKCRVLPRECAPSGRLIRDISDYNGGARKATTSVHVGLKEIAVSEVMSTKCSCEAVIEIKMENGVGIAAPWMNAWQVVVASARCCFVDSIRDCVACL